MKNVTNPNFFDANPPGVTERLMNATVGLAGAGGLGSNIAASLVRAGLGKLIVADFDRIVWSNLNRQFYFPPQVGALKVEALRENLLLIRPDLEISIIRERITPENLAEFFAEAEIMIEAFDLPDQKAMLANSWSKQFPERHLVMASGLAGYGKSDLLRTEKRGNITICGDQCSSLDSEGGYTAPRVAITANLQANAAIELLMNH